MRYNIEYLTRDGKWYVVEARTIKEAITLYDMIGDEAEFKVLLDNVNGEQIKNT